MKIKIREALLALSMCDKLCLVWFTALPPTGICRGFFPYISLISPGGNYIESETVAWDEERSSKVAIGRGRAQRPILHVNEPQKTDARSARALGVVKTCYYCKNKKPREPLKILEVV